MSAKETSLMPSLRSSNSLTRRSVTLKASFHHICKSMKTKPKKESNPSHQISQSPNSKSSLSSNCRLKFQWWKSSNQTLFKAQVCWAPAPKKIRCDLDRCQTRRKRSNSLLRHPSSTWSATSKSRMLSPIWPMWFSRIWVGLATRSLIRKRKTKTSLRKTSLRNQARSKSWLRCSCRTASYWSTIQKSTWSRCASF